MTDLNLKIRQKTTSCIDLQYDCVSITSQVEQAVNFGYSHSSWRLELIQDLYFSLGIQIKLQGFKANFTRGMIFWLSQNWLCFEFAQLNSKQPIFEQVKNFLPQSKFVLILRKSLFSTFYQKIWQLILHNTAVAIICRTDELSLSWLGFVYNSGFW